MFDDGEKSCFPICYGLSQYSQRKAQSLAKNVISSARISSKAISMARLISRTTVHFVGLLDLRFQMEGASCNVYWSLAHKEVVFNKTYDHMDTSIMIFLL
jgi:hypothetical protein